MAMRARGLCILSLTCACSGEQPDFSSDIGQLEQPIVQGTQSDASEDATLYVRTRFSPTQGVSCTGTLVAPNLVVTALHCVTENELLMFACNNDGTLEDENRTDGALGRLAPPSAVNIFTGILTEGIPESQEPDAVAVQLFGTGSNQICRNDLAVVLLDRDLDLPISSMRLETTVRWGDLVRVVGYGRTGVDGDAGRFTRSGVRIVDVGPMTDGGDLGTAAPRTFVTNEGACHGDSGGPAFDQETGALVGVYSLSAGETCESTGIRNVYTHLNPFSSFVLDAFEAAGAEPLLEDDGSVDEEPAAAADEGGCAIGNARARSSTPPAAGFALLAAALLVRSARRRR